MAEKGKTTKTTPPSEWFKNVAKSIGYSSTAIIKDIVPNMYSMASDNINYANELADQLKDASSGSKSFTSMINADTYVNIAKSAITNAYDDILSGKIYNQERQLASMEDDGFGDFDIDSMTEQGFTSMDKGDTKDSSSEKPTVVNKTVNNNVTVNKPDTSVNENVYKMIAANAKMNKASTEAILETNTKLVSNKMAVDQNIAMNQMKLMETVNSNIGLLVDFQNDSMAKYIGASIQYYDESLTSLKESLEIMKASAPKTREMRQVENGYDEVFSGGTFSMEGYVNTVKKNFDKLKEENMLVNSLFTMGSNTEHLQHLADAPLKFLSDTISKQLIPLTIRTTMERLDKSVTEFVPALMSKFSRMGQSSNPLAEIVGKLFGIDTRIKTSPRMENYERGAISYDGESKRALVDVIPTYLRKMLAHMTGTKEIAFDWNEGKWSDVKSMRDRYEEQKMRQVTSGYGDAYSEVTSYLQNVRFNNSDEEKKMRQGIDKFFYNLAKEEGVVKLDGTMESKSKIRQLSGIEDTNLNELLSAILNNMDNSMKMSTVNNYKALSNMNKFFSEIENNPTMHNAMTLLTGLNNDEHVDLDVEGNVKALKKYKGGAFGERKVDSFGKDSIFYLRGIMETLISGIKVFTAGSVGGGKKGKEPDFIQERIDTFKSMTSTTLKNPTSLTPAEDLDGVDTDGSKAKKKQSLQSRNVIDIASSKTDTSTFESDIASIKAMRDKEGKSNKDVFGDTIGGMMDKNQNKFYRVRENLDSIVSKPAAMLEAAFLKIDNTLYDIIFGKGNDPSTSFMSGVMDKMTDMFEKVGDFAIDKIFVPAGEFLSGAFSKVGKAANDNPIVQAVKDGVKYWFVGESKDGKREGGVFSEIMNSTSDLVKSFSHSVTGIAYKDSRGVQHESNPNSLFGGVKDVVKDIYVSTKLHFFGDKNDSDPDKRSGIVTKIGDQLGDGIQEWKNVIFGTEVNKDKQGREVLKENVSFLVKSAPKAAIGGGLGLLAGSAIYGGGLGLVGSFLLPGGPIGAALLGTALGIATSSDSFKDWAFGEIGGDGKRIGGALISSNTKEFFKNNKTTLIGGAVGGLAMGAVSNALIDGFIPGAGAMASFLSPFGPIGSAFQGMATAMVLKSETVMSWMFGHKNMDGARVGGLFQRIFRKPNAAISKESAKRGLGFTALGIGAGAVTGSLLSSVLPTFGLIGAMLATPIGPVTGAVAGLAAAIALSSGKVNKLLFGDKGDNPDNEGIIERAMNSFKMHVVDPVGQSFKNTGKHFANWIMNKHIPALMNATEPLLRVTKDFATDALKVTKGILLDIPWFVVKNTGKGIAETFKFVHKQISETKLYQTINENITKPLIDRVNTVVSVPFRLFTSGIFKAGTNIAQGLNNVGASILQVPAQMATAMSFARDGTRSILQGTGNLFKGAWDLIRNGSATTTDGRMVRGKGALSSLVGDAFSGNRIYNDAMAGVGPMMASIMMRRNEANEKFQSRKAEIKEENSAWKEQWKKDKDSSGNNMYYGRGRHKRMRPAHTAKFIKNFEEKTGITVNEALNLDPRTQIEELKKNQVDYLNTLVKDSINTGKTGSAFKKHRGIEAYQRSQAEAMSSIDSEVSKATGILGDIYKVVESIGSGNGTAVIKIDGNMSQFTQFTSNSNDTFKKAKDKYVNDVIYHGNRPEDESIGGSILSSIGKGVASTGMGMLSKVLPRRYSSEQVEEIGCGPIVLSMVLSNYGVRTSAEKIFNIALDSGLVEPGIGVSSDIFKLMAKKHQMEYGSYKPSNAAFERAFKLSAYVIARLSTDNGHYVLLRSYNKKTGTVIVTDPMGKMSGEIKVSKLMTYTTHLYIVYKKGLSNITNKIMNSLKSSSSGVSMEGEMSIGGSAISPSAIKIPGMSNVQGGVTPVVAMKTKDQEELEAIRHEELISAILGSGSGSGDSAGISDEVGMGGGEAIKSHRMGLNRINAWTRFGGILVDAMRYVFTGVKGRMLPSEMTHSGSDTVAKKGGIIGSMRDSISRVFNRNKGGVDSSTGETTADTSGRVGNNTAVRPRGNVVSRGMRAGLTGARRVIGYFGGMGNIASKTMNALSQAGNLAAFTNLSATGGYSTASSAEENFAFQNDGTSEGSQRKAFNKRRNVNYFLEKKAEEAAAALDTKYKTTLMDVNTRTEINTRITAQVLADMLDLHKGFYDWLKPFLENLDFCCNGGGMPDIDLDFDKPKPPPRPPTKPPTGPQKPPKPPTNPPKPPTNPPKPPSNLPSPKPPTGPPRIPPIPPINTRKFPQLPPPPTQRHDRQLPGPNPRNRQLPAPTTRRVKDAVTGKYRDMDIRRDVIDADFEVINERRTLGRNGGTPQLELPAPSGKKGGRTLKRESVSGRVTKVEPANRPQTVSRRVTEAIDADFTEINEHLERQRRVTQGYDTLNDRANNSRSGNHKKKGKISKLLGKLKGNDSLGIMGSSSRELAEDFTQDELRASLRGFNPRDVGRSVGETGGRQLAKTAGKSTLKTAAKVVGGVATGGLLTAGLAAADYGIGRANAAEIYGKAPGTEMTNNQKRGAGVASAVTGLIPFGDMIDQAAFDGKMKEKIATLTEGTLNLVGKAGESITGGWESMSTSLGEKVSGIVSSTTEKWESMRTNVSTKWDETKTSVTEKASSIVTGTKEKWESLKTTVSTKWTETKTSVTEKVSSVLADSKAKWESIKTSVSTKWTDTKNAVVGKVEGIVTGTKEKWESIKTSVIEKYESIKESILGKIQSAIDSLPSFSLSEAFESLKTSISGKISKAADNFSLGKLFGGGKGTPGGQGGPGSSVQEAIELNAEINGDKAYGKGDDTYYQNDSRWGSKQLSGKATMSTSGCGPTVAATLVKSMTGENVKPTDAAKFAVNKGLVDENKGVSSEIFHGFGQRYGLQTNATDTSKDNIANQLAAGNKMILRGEQGDNYTKSGHYIIADGISANGNVIVKDPLGKSRSGEFSLDAVSKGLTDAFAVSGNGESVSKFLDAKNGNVYASGGSGFSNPLPKGRITSRYGFRNDPHTGRRTMHWGIDLSTGKNTNIQAAADGVVTKASKHKSYGNYVIIKHVINGNRMDTVYAHLSVIQVREGQNVKQGQIIGKEGSTGKSTGNHLHFEIHKGPYKYKVNNINPEPLIFKNGNPTPEGFTDGSIIGGVAGAAAAAAAASFNPADALETMQFLPAGIQALPGIMDNMAKIALFGAPISLLAGTLLDPSNATGSTGEAGEAINTSFNPKGDKKVFIDKVKPGAIKSYKEYGVLPSLVMAQAALESGWGAKSIGNNIFGIKAGSSWKGKTQNVWTTENINGRDVSVQATFRDYASIEDSILDHAKVLQKDRYAGVLSAKNYREATKAVKEGGYATDPNYTKLLNDIIESNGFMQVDNQVKGIGGPDSADIFDIYKEMEGSKANSYANGYSLMGIGGPGDEDIKSLNDEISKTVERVETIGATYNNTNEVVHGLGKGITDIKSEKQKLDKYTHNREQTVAKGEGSSSMITLDSVWSDENVNRVVTALETIASNTSSGRSANVNVINANKQSSGGNTTVAPRHREQNVDFAKRASSMSQLRK